MGNQIEILSTIRIEYSNDLYKIVDILNRTLKKEDLMFGLSLDKKDPNIAIFTIYRT
ncbi:MAG TPA: YpmA family protein [Bacillus sp. (in: firmicutes)]|uniref:YpmA family protein n=1 Tax=Bacillus litorisediminis TaxID=2922713 RepID=UPI001FAC9925|nr:YpmA family protein [Bacillus litorisediminis]HWO76366.1 YpmA family protein [Bacillus sp. (in: firmicutes)]